MDAKYILYELNDIFLITTIDVDFGEMKRIDHNYKKLYGYVFTKDKVIKNKILDNSESSFVEKNKDTLSGIFCYLRISDGVISLQVDPLVQYNLFYYFDQDGMYISNSLSCIKEHTGQKEACINYLIDSIIYGSPMRGGTIVKNINMLQYSDFSNYCFKSKRNFRDLVCYNLKLIDINFDYYKEYSYIELKEKYIKRLNQRANILASNFNEIYIQLTGGADSRLVLSSFLNFENFSCYVYGDGTSQNRLVYEEIVSSLNLKRSKKIPFRGAPLVTPALIIKALFDTNFLKLNNINTYVNTDYFIAEDSCKVTGYYGANVCGGIGIPSIKNNKRLLGLDESKLTHASYVNEMNKLLSNYRPASLKDIFYLNNRGPSHYASHSLADNKVSNSFDILYDPINLHLVDKCPYSDSSIDRNSISIDLIYLNHKQLALFPYDERKIPYFREFDDIPLINCFNGYKFPSSILPDTVYEKYDVDASSYDFLGKGANYKSIDEIINFKEFDTFFNKYKFIKEVSENHINNKTIVSYYLLGISALGLSF